MEAGEPVPGRKVIIILSLLLFCYSFVRVLYSGIPRTSLPHAPISTLSAAHYQRQDIHKNDENIFRMSMWSAERSVVAWAPTSGSVMDQLNMEEVRPRNQSEKDQSALMASKERENQTSTKWNPAQTFEWEFLLVLLLLAREYPKLGEQTLLKEKMRKLVRMGLFVPHFIALMRIGDHFTWFRIAKVKSCT